MTAYYNHHSESINPADFRPAGDAYRSADISHRSESRWVEPGTIDGVPAERHWHETRWVTGVAVVE